MLQEIKRMFLLYEEPIMKRLLLALFMTSFIGAKDNVVKTKFNYSMSLYYETNLMTHTTKSLAFVNNKHLTCLCGKDPVLIMIVYGHVQGFCFDHLPPMGFSCDCNCCSRDL